MKDRLQSLIFPILRGAAGFQVVRVRCDEITSRQFRNALSHEGLQGPARSLTRVAPSLRAARAPVAPEPIRARCIPSHTPQTAADEPAKGPEHLADSGPQEGRRGGSPPLNMQWPSPLRNARGRPRPGRGDKTSVSLTVHRSRNWHVRYSSRSKSPQASDHARRRRRRVNSTHGNADAAATQARSVRGARRRRAEQRAADPSLRASRA